MECGGEEIAVQMCVYVCTCVCVCVCVCVSLQYSTCTMVMPY